MKKIKKQNTKLYQIGLTLMKALPLLLLILLSSCAMGKKMRLEVFTYDLSRNAQLSVNYIKRVNREINFDLLGISLETNSVAIKVEDIECGAGSTKFKAIVINGAKDGLLILPKTSYADFKVYCTNDQDVPEEEVPYILFKYLYQYEGETLGKVLDSDVKIKFK